MPKAKKKTEETENTENAAIGIPAETENTESEVPFIPELETPELPEIIEPAKPVIPAIAEKKTPAKRKERPPPILTIESGNEIESQKYKDDLLWHEIQNAYKTKKILSGTLSGIERIFDGSSVAVIDYRGVRVVVPINNMLTALSKDEENIHGEMSLRKNKIVGNMLGAEVDFIIKGIDSKTRSVVASRVEAMMKKRQTFFMDTGKSSAHKIREGRIVQARVITVTDSSVRFEVFGVECSILIKDLSWDWINSVHEKYTIGDEVLVKVTEINCKSIDNISIKVDVKSITVDTNAENLKKCRPQGKYAGRITNIDKGMYFIRLNIGVNAIAHSCYDSKLPGKKDDISFAVTHIDNERQVAVGLITKIIKQNL